MSTQTREREVSRLVSARGPASHAREHVPIATQTREREVSRLVSARGPANGAWTLGRRPSAHPPGSQPTHVDDLK
jgi:hypothetical protein